MLKEVLDAILTIEQRQAGFYLEEDENSLYLFDQEGKRRGVFSSKGATYKAIRDTVDRLIKSAS